MVTEEVVTGLRNAVEHGESLQDAMQIMMNSGYSPIEVQEASKYVGGGAVHLQQSNSEGNLVMPSQKSRISNMAFWRNKKLVQQPVQQPKINQIQQSPIQQPQTQQFQQQQIKQTMQQQEVEQFPVQQIPQFSPTHQSSLPLTKQLEKIRPPRPSPLKEIILLIILMALIGLLVATILYKDTILAWFS